MNILVSYNWLKHYAAIKDSPDVLARKLSLSGPSVEKINRVRPQFENVIIGEILEIKKHSNADKLQLVKVIAGKNKVLDIVCGAFNIKIGDKVPVAKAGARLAGGLVIVERDVRGVKSQGMLCSEKELGISENHRGIFILPKEASVGADLAKALDMEDWIFDAEITTNRPDALGMVGFAREASAITGAKFLWKEKSKIQAKKFGAKTKSPFSLSVKIEDKSQCPRYMAAVISGVKVADSPFWFKKRLISAGLRPINNIVDITNYAMLEFGQPLHAFDADKISGGEHKEIIVRQAKAGEEIETLDGAKRKLNPDVLIIADREKPIAIAGVIGGIDSSVSAATKTIILEAANFIPKAIRKSARTLNLFSDSSNRFEKGLSAEFPRIALSRAIGLTRDLSGGAQSGKITDAYFKKYRPARVVLEFRRLYQKLGVIISPKKAIKILENLGFKIAAKNKTGVKVIAPYWRQGDIEIPDDLIEEIARIYGYHNLPATLPKGEIPEKSGRDCFSREERIKDFISDLGFCEVYGNSMVSEKMLADFGVNPAGALKIKNPLNEDMVYMRSTLIPSLLKIISKNSRHKKEISIFEIANVYLSQESNEKIRLPKEEMTLAMAATFSSGEAFAKLRAVSEALLKKSGINEKDTTFTPEIRENLHPTRTAVIKIAGVEIGIVGEIHPMALKNFDISQRVAVAEISFEKLEMFASDKKIYAPVSKFPSVEIDLAMVLGKEINWSDIKKEILGINPLIAGVELFDIYAGKNITNGKKSLAFHILLQSFEGTLREEEVKKITGRIIEKLKGKFGAELRK